MPRFLTPSQLLKAVDDIFYPYRPHQEHLTTLFGRLIYNDQIVISEAISTSMIAMLHRGHVVITKIYQAVESFWWPGMQREHRKESENCPSCRAAGKNLETNTVPGIEKIGEFFRTRERKQLDYAGPIKSRTRGDVYILVAIDPFTKRPSAHFCKNTNTRTVSMFLTEYCSDNGTSRTIRTTTVVVFK